MRLDAAAIVLRPRSVAEVMDLACRLGAVHRGLYLRVAAATLLPCFALCLAARYVLGWGWLSTWLLAAALATVAKGAFTVLVGHLLFAEAEAQIEKLRAQGESLDYEISRRTVRAPATGTLVDVLPISAGMTITSQQRLATILPEGRLRVVALFSPREGLGRVRAGQPATLRIDNFPWTQFGTVGAMVEQVGAEARDGMIRVELDVTRPNPAIPIEHGLTLACEVEVEHLSPAQLMRRSMGEWMQPPESEGARAP